jgi:beta-ribofuranosylaminobenzene 5'-phosphate synthase
MDGIGRVDGGSRTYPFISDIEITAEEAEEVSIEGLKDFADRMEKAAKTLLPEGKGIRVNVEEVYPAHVGFGSGTQSSWRRAAVNELYGLGNECQRTRTHSKKRRNFRYRSNCF